MTRPGGKGTTPATGPSASASSWRPAMMLTLATVGFAVTFWAWALLSPLSATLREQLSLT